MTYSVLVTGGAGYIGSHTVVELLEAGMGVVVVDNFSNARRSVVDRIARIAKRAPLHIEADIRNRAAMREIFANHAIDAVIHFAGLKAVGESVAQPLRYYDNNVAGSIVLFEEMAAAGVKRLVFSSSATVYGDPETVPIREDAPLSATNPYGQSKLMIELMLRDIAVSDPGWRIALLRYFNPVGAHPSGFIGEDPNGTPNNLLPYIAQVASGRLEHLQVFGGDYPTRDGTGVRDYIHVVDLARGHLRALDALPDVKGVLTANLGTGSGYTVLEMVRAFESASGQKIPFRIVGRRVGDIAECFADPGYASHVLGWRAQLGIDVMCADTWRWQQWANSNLQGNPESRRPQEFAAC
ncbi:MAG: UDP-glucose 4-epimerase GalE [Betaproteobacteria bacterium]|nr:UDP-glucose 4-epimerase GalE [Betaproteobacteria bacterium]